MRASLKPAMAGGRYWSVSRLENGPPPARRSAERSMAKFTACRSRGLFRNNGRDLLNA